MEKSTEIISDSEAHAITQRKVGATASIVVAIIGLTGVNVAPEHAQMIGSAIALLVPCLPSIWGAFRRR